MLPFTRQVQIACRFAEESAARLAGAEVPAPHDNSEKTLGELQKRIGAGRTYLERFKAEQMDGSEGREVILTIAGTRSSSTASNICCASPCRTSISIARPLTQSCASPGSRSGNAISWVPFRNTRA
jgi:uncharacterized small protein (DUF1192 family)